MVNYKDELIISYGLFIAAHSRLYRKIGQTLQDQFGLPCPWFEILLLISQSDEKHLKMSELADHVLLTTGGITRLIDRMVAAGLVARTPCPTDRRIQWVVLTEKGCEIMEQTIPLHLEDLKQNYQSAFTPAEFKQFNALIDQLRTYNDQKENE